MTPKHTPGPWRTGDLFHTVFGPKGDTPSPRTIAKLGFGPIPTEETRANARLIASAPDLLFAADLCYKWFNAPGEITADGMNEIALLLKQAIDKATGEPTK